MTMLPEMVERVHDADVTFHDNTYKCVFGKWMEGEIVIFDKRINKRLTVARIYVTRETRKAYHLSFGGFFDVVEAVTGHPVQLKFLDGRGLKAILVDRWKPQVDGCGDDLVI